MANNPAFPNDFQPGDERWLASWNRLNAEVWEGHLNPRYDTFYWRVAIRRTYVSPRLARRIVTLLTDGYRVKYATRASQVELAVLHMRQAASGGDYAGFTRALRQFLAFHDLIYPDKEE